MLKDLVHKALQTQTQKATQTLDPDDLKVATWLATIENNLTEDQAQLSSKNIITNDIIQLCKGNLLRFEHAASESDQTLCKAFIKEYQTDFTFDGADPVVRLQQLIEMYLKELGFDYNKERKEQQIQYNFSHQSLQFKLNKDLWDLIPSYVKDAKFSHNNEQLRSAIDDMSDEEIRNNVRLLVIKKLELNLDQVYIKKMTTLTKSIDSDKINYLSQKETQKFTDLINAYNWIKRFIYKYRDDHIDLDSFYYDEAYANLQTGEVVIRIGNYVKIIDDATLTQRKFVQLRGTRFVKAVKDYYEKMTSSDYYTKYGFHDIEFEEFIFDSLNQINWVKVRKSTNNHYVKNN